MEDKNPQVRVMSNSERNDYDGVTIDENTGAEEAPKQDPYQRITFHTLSWKDLLFSNSTWLTRIAIVLVLLAVAGIFVFAVMPVLLVLVGVGIVAWLLMNFIFH